MCGVIFRWFFICEFFEIVFLNWIFPLAVVLQVTHLWHNKSIQNVDEHKEHENLQQCYYRGRVRGDDHSFVTVSLCGGMVSVLLLLFVNKFQFFLFIDFSCGQSWSTAIRCKLITNSIVNLKSKRRIDNVECFDNLFECKCNLTRRETNRITFFECVCDVVVAAYCSWQECNYKQFIWFCENCATQHSINKTKQLLLLLFLVYYFCRSQNKLSICFFCFVLLFSLFIWFD